MRDVRATMSWSQWRDAYPDGWVLSRTPERIATTVATTTSTATKRARPVPVRRRGRSSARAEGARRRDGGSGGPGRCFPEGAVRRGCSSSMCPVTKSCSGPSQGLRFAGHGRHRRGSRARCQRRLPPHGQRQAADLHRRRRADVPGQRDRVDAGHPQSCPCRTLEGSRLEPAPHLGTFSFSWAAIHPETRVLSPRVSQREGIARCFHRLCVRGRGAGAATRMTDSAPDPEAWPS